MDVHTCACDCMHYCDISAFVRDNSVSMAALTMHSIMNAWQGLLQVIWDQQGPGQRESVDLMDILEWTRTQCKLSTAIPAGFSFNNGIISLLVFFSLVRSPRCFGACSAYLPPLSRIPYHQDPARNRYKQRAQPRYSYSLTSPAASIQQLHKEILH